MKLESARELVERYFKQVNALYGGVLFDEWAVVAFREGKGLLLTYNGPRKADFQKDFSEDVSPLSAERKMNEYGNGDFEFARTAEGTKVDAFVKLGDSAYLFCNNTVTNMGDLTKNAKWLSAQSAFAELCEHFRTDPLQA